MRGRKAADAVILPKFTWLSKELHSLAMQKFAYVAKLCLSPFPRLALLIVGRISLCSLRVEISFIGPLALLEQKISESSTCETSLFAPKLAQRTENDVSKTTFAPSGRL